MNDHSPRRPDGHWYAGLTLTLGVLRSANASSALLGSVSKDLQRQKLKRLCARDNQSVRPLPHIPRS